MRLSKSLDNLNANSIFKKTKGSMVQFSTLITAEESRTPTHNRQRRRQPCSRRTRADRR